MSESLRQLVAAELSVPVDPQVAAFAAAIAAPYGDAARAVLFYGSCLRLSDFNGLMLDFYLIVSDYDAAYAKPWLARWNRRLPPNVFPAQHDGLVAKVAVLDTADFTALNRPGASAVSVWARFAQPSRLVWAADDTVLSAMALSIAAAAPTLLDGALAHMARPMTLPELWESGFALTYGAELRAERKDRPASVLSFDPERYDRLGRAALCHTAIGTQMIGDRVEILPDQSAKIAAEQARWPGLRRRGKWLTLARLAKAAFTYAGGIDYLAWKINRHAGTDIRVRGWQRRFPFLGALVLLPRLWMKGAVR